MPITREDVVRCYREILGRKPESEEVIELHMQFKGTVLEFRQALLNSDEYRRRKHLVEEKYTELEILPASAMVREDLDVWHYIELLERGAVCLYLVDAKGRYLWHAMVGSNCRLEADGNGGWFLSKESLAPLIFEQPLVGHEEELLNMVRMRLASHAELREVLVVDSGGAAVCVVRTKEKQAEFSWARLENFVASIESLLPTGRIYISCPSNARLRSFMENFSSRLDMVPLSEENYKKVLDGTADGILLYDKDIFPDCPKIGIREIWHKVHEAALDRMGAAWYKQQKHWASVKGKVADNLPCIIKKFDEGYKSVYVLDENENYVGMIERGQGCRCLLEPEQVVPQNLAVPFTGNGWTDKRRIASLLGPWREAPLVKSGRLVASVTWADSGGMSNQEIYAQQPLYWELISDDVAEEYFRGRKRVFLSSIAGSLSGFNERFAEMLEITVYDGRNLEICLQGETDLMLYGADVWPKSKAEKQAARCAYAEMMAETLRRYFTAHGISWYRCDLKQPVANMKQRVAPRSQARPSAPPYKWSSLAEDYSAPADHTEGKYFKVIGGHRQDAPYLEHSERQIFVYGPCTALGVEAPFGETIEARLQALCVDSGHSWRTVNCGSVSDSYDVSMLNYMLHTPMRHGDIVVYFSNELPEPKLFHDDHFYYSRDAFDDAVHLQGQYFWEASSVHVNAAGYAVWAEFLFRKFTENPCLMEKPKSRNLLPPLARRLGEIQIRNPEMRKYLSDLRMHSRAVHGAIVMNANPFTFGHRYLVEKACRQVPYLYVFVVQEDKSEIPFADRFAMVQAGCADLENVAVLPSGQYMISSQTFAEYFDKAERQEESIMPSQDITLFGEAIAPTLGIAKRFVGEEPFDKVTRQYNEAMKRLLPDYGVELVEIPRKKAADGQAINATQVREWIKAGQWEKCRAYLPESSIAYLQQMIDRCEK